MLLFEQNELLMLTESEPKKIILNKPTLAPMVYLRISALDIQNAFGIRVVYIGDNKQCTVHWDTVYIPYGSVEIGMDRLATEKYKDFICISLELTYIKPDIEDKNNSPFPLKVSAYEFTPQLHAAYLDRNDGGA